MVLTKENIDRLKQIPFNETGIVLSDQEVLEMRSRIIESPRIVHRKIPEDE